MRDNPHYQSDRNLREPQTFQEVRSHLGVETQRQWSDLAIARTTPVLLSLFSIVTLLAHRLARKGQLPIRQAAWYIKNQGTFSDAIAAVRQQLWHPANFFTSCSEPKMMQFRVHCFPAYATQFAMQRDWIKSS